MLERCITVWGLGFRVCLGASLFGGVFGFKVSGHHLLGNEVLKWWFLAWGSGCKLSF